MSARMAISGSMVFLACTLGNPAKLSLLPDTAQAAGARRVVCSSVNHRYSYCGVDTRRGVQLTSQLSKSRCVQGRSWDYDRGGIWVDDGCSAEFLVAGSGRNPSAGDLAAAIIVGGVVGAILDNNNSHRHHSDSYYPKPRHRRDDQWIDPTPQFDNQGNPNFDTHGNYQGPHGLGKLVTPDDNPDLNPALRSDGDDSDDSY
ncbi:MULTISPECIES: DUF3011 domain-containing protein [unclassified Mesorhizobium]|uniref:DUF3011 domain-containing protein n=3 Tax=Mesorhizobium TaxID=68287 RepID=UPI0019D455F5|nr:MULTISPECIES: DUF3011 domain-containing protein [unclassified Mesorhizobium]